MEWKDADYFAALYEVAKAINSSLNLSEVLNRIVESTVRAMGVKACAIRLLSSDKKRLIFGAAHGLSGDYLQKGTVEVDKSGVDREVLQRKPVAILDATRDPAWQYPEAAQKEGITSVLSVPLAVRESMIGVMRVYTSSPQAFTGGQIHFLSAVANLGAIAIHNARMYEALKVDYESMKGDLEEWYASEGLILPE